MSVLNFSLSTMALLSQNRTVLVVIFALVYCLGEHEARRNCKLKEHALKEGALHSQFHCCQPGGVARKIEIESQGKALVRAT